MVSTPGRVAGIRNSVPQSSCVRIVLLLLSIPDPSRAQLNTAATLNGTVTDSSGAVVEGAAVTVTNQESGVTTPLKTNSEGSYVAAALAAGTYVVEVIKPGFQTYRVKNIVLHPAIVQTVNVALSAGQVQTKVEVQASVVAIETATPELSAEMSETQAGHLS